MSIEMCERIYTDFIENKRYCAVSKNLSKAINTIAGDCFSSIPETLAVFFIYFHFDEEPRIISITDLRQGKNNFHGEKNELLVIYVGYKDGKPADEFCRCNAEKCLTLLENQESVLSEQGVSGFQSPHYAVKVTNELFHNGNIEAWKKIISAYQNHYGNTKVAVIFDGQKIQQLDALFKWGKVQRGMDIHFSLSGEKPANIAKLKKCLEQAASAQFEPFLSEDFCAKLWT